MLLDTRGKKCPEPLVMFRRAIKKMKQGEKIEIVGDDERSSAEIVMAADELGMKVLELSGDKEWKIVIKK